MNTEKGLFEFVKSNYLPDLVMSRRQFSKWDCYSPQYKKRVELKCRRKHYDELVIERKKYDALIEKCKPHGDEPIYICSTPDGVWAFNLYRLPEPEWETKRMPQTTDFGQRQYVDKEVGYLRTTDGVELNKI